MSVEVREYQTQDQRIPFTEWLTVLRDRRAVQAITARITRMQQGNRGDWKAIGSGLFELRIDSGPGYRLYCGQDGKALVLLLCAGSKRNQVKDIEVAHGYWKDYKSRTR